MYKICNCGEKGELRRKPIKADCATKQDYCDGMADYFVDITHDSEDRPPECPDLALPEAGH